MVFSNLQFKVIRDDDDFVVVCTFTCIYSLNVVCELEEKKS